MKTKKYVAIFNINIQYELEAASIEEAEEKAEELGATVELPDEYVSDSIEFVKVMENDE